MRIDIRGLRVLITAASRGIGFEIAKGLALEGCELTISSRSERIFKAAEEIKRAGGKVYALRADLTSYDDVSRLVKRSIEIMGRVDALIFNAGNVSKEPAGFLETDPEDWEYAVKLHLLSPIWLTLKLSKHMISRGSGKIIYLSSVTVKEPMSTLVLADVTRAPLLQLTKLLAKELGSKGIKVYLVLLGSFDTPGARELINRISRLKGMDFKEVWEKEVISKIPLRRVGRFSELTSLIIFLLSNYSDYLNGSVLSLDGGMSKAI